MFSHIEIRLTNTSATCSCFVDIDVLFDASVWFDFYESLLFSYKEEKMTGKFRREMEIQSMGAGEQM